MVFLSHSVDPAAVTGDQHETPTEIAINKEDLEVLKILANFTEVPNKIKHKQLRIMLDREKRRPQTAETGQAWLSLENTQQLKPQQHEAAFHPEPKEV